MSVMNMSLFSQLLQHFPRTEFQRLVRKHGAEKGAKGFKCWTQFVAMMFCHMAHADSLRDICNGLASCIGKLKHLGIGRRPNKSTLSYANAHRPAAMFEELFYEVSQRFRTQSIFQCRKKKFRFKNPLYSLDSTTISLCLTLFPWASFRRAKGGVKLHVLLDHDTYMPEYVLIKEARRHDRIGARALALRPGSIVAMDMAYNDYDLFSRWSEEGVFFVTRQKSNADYEVVEERPVPKNRNIISDETIRLTGAAGEKKCPRHLRRVVVWDKKNQCDIVLLTNHMEFGSTTIAAIYKDRWEIEVFFKALKQNLKIRTFVGTSENALRIQIWTALITLVLLKWLKHLAHASWSFSNLASLVRINLFAHRPLNEWLREPFGKPPDDEPDNQSGIQLELPLPGFGHLT